MAKLFIAILVITILEGAFRKWVSGSLTYPLVGIRDSLALLGILIAIKKGYYTYSPNLVITLFLACFLIFLWGIFQTIVNQSSLSILLFGYRFWFLYLWFALLAGICLSDRDFKYIAKLLSWLLIVMTPLAVLQHFSSPSSFLNKQADDGSAIFVVTENIVRTTGTFSFTAGYSIFLAMSSPLILMGIHSKDLWQQRWKLWLALISLLIATIVSGSRGAILFFGALVTIYAVSNLYFSKGKEKKKALLLLLAIPIAIFVLSQVFSRAVEATTERFETAAQHENMGERLAYTFFPQGEFSFVGKGLGMGSNVASFFLTGEKGFGLAEGENARVIQEGGLVGYLVLFMKIAAVCFALYRSLILAKLTGKVLSLTMWLTAGLALLSWQMSGQLTINTLGYLLVGLSIASLRLESAGKLK